MRALVTGCAGFIGSHLVDRLLALGYEVVGIDCFTDYYPREIKEANVADALHNPKFRLIAKNILDIKEAETPEVDHVFHLAAQAGVRPSWGRNFEIYLRNNIAATQRLLELYKEKPIQRFVYASSSSVYGEAELAVKEDIVLKPESPYGMTKLAAENLCYLYHLNYDIPVISLRYFSVYGPRQRPDMAIHKFVQGIWQGEEITVYGDGEQTRDFTYVAEVVGANILAASSQGVGEVFNIGAGRRVSVNELIKQIEQVTGRKARLKYTEGQKGDVLNTLADINKAKKILNWAPKVKLDAGLGQYIAWFSRNIRKE